MSETRPTPLTSTPGAHTPSAAARAKTVCSTCSSTKGRRDCVQQMCLSCCRLRSLDCAAHRPLSGPSSALRSRDTAASSSDSKMPVEDIIDVDHDDADREGDGSAAYTAAEVRRLIESSAAETTGLAATAAARQTAALAAANAAALSLTAPAAETPPAWAAGLLALPAQLLALQQQVLSMQAERASSSSSQSASPQLPPMPQSAGVNPQRTVPLQSQPVAAVGLPPHLQAFGPTGQVAASAHINTQINHQYSRPSADLAGSMSHFLGHMTGGLAPVIAGQDGPSLEQLIGRTVKDWKPYRSDDDFREALSDQMGSIQAALMSGTNGGDSAKLLRVLKYLSQTRDYVHRYGHTVVFKYHQRAMKAAKEALYDPAEHGPVYMLGHSEVLQNAVDKTVRRSAPPVRPAGAKGTAAPPTRRDTNKRPRSTETCDRHPNSGHTNAECKSQHSDKRPAPSTEK